MGKETQEVHLVGGVERLKDGIVGNGVWSGALTQLERLEHAFTTQHVKQGQAGGGGGSELDEREREKVHEREKVREEVGERGYKSRLFKWSFEIKIK